MSRFEIAEVPRTAAAAPPTFAFGDAQMADFLARMRNAVLATNRPDGSPQATPAWYHWDGRVMRISSPGWTLKVRNIRRDPRVSVCVDDQLSGTYVTLFGTAEIVDGPTVREESWPVLLKYLHEDEATVRWTRINAGDDRVVIRITPRKIIWRNAVR
ncbi:PPOX class F420-dependent oxidoreductase [Dactylosporangium sp. CA-052675]|uniref:PPOX class F420-dependent oxidoreductase n=1 Tax=Dactylosporangium sp. CA-052675 TaxID=3239927 RepID=UPI003D8BA4A0